MQRLTEEGHRSAQNNRDRIQALEELYNAIKDDSPDGIRAVCRAFPDVVLLTVTAPNFPPELRAFCLDALEKSS